MKRRTTATVTAAVVVAVLALLSPAGAVNGDLAVEPDETFLLKLSSPKVALISDTQGQSTIVNDD
jgi:hypothetical protein